MKRVRRPLDDLADHYKRNGTKGRPSKLTPAMEAKITTFCDLSGGPSYDEVAVYIGVNRSTFQRWLQRYPTLRRLVDDAVTNGLNKLRMSLVSKARRGNVAALKFTLERRHPDFRRNLGVDVNVAPPNYDADAPPPDYV